MGRDMEYQPCPISPGKLEEKMKLTCRSALISVAILVLAGLAVLFLALYVEQAYSDPAKQLRECQAQVQNQSSEAQAQITSLRHRVEDVQEAAEKEAGIWSLKLAAANQTLAETQKNWRSCQNQLSTLQDNFTSLEAQERSQKETIRDLQQQLAEKSKQLGDEQRNFQEERKRYEAEIQQLRDQKQRDNSNGCGRELAGLSIILLTIVIAGFLSV